MIKACKKYIKTFKTHFKKSKNAKKIEADKQSANPKHYPLQLSQNEIEYVRNTLSSAGGGHIWSLTLVVLPFWRFCTRQCVLSAWNLMKNG